MNTRLESVSPELANSLVMSDLTIQRKAAAAACAVALTASKLNDRVAAEALVALRNETEAPQQLIEGVARLARLRDEAYFDAQERADGETTPEVLVLFSEARAASALEFALAGDSVSQAEAIYEAISACDDPNMVIRVVRTSLKLR